MSGLLERIVRRRRASAGSRPGLPPSEPATAASAPELDGNGHPVNGAHVNGHVVAAALNGRAAVEPANDSGAAAALDEGPAPPEEAGSEEVAAIDAVTGSETVDTSDAVTGSETVDTSDAVTASETVDTSDAVTASDAVATGDEHVEAATGAPTTEPAAPAASSTRPGLAERGRIRRRVRFLHALRELQLRDLGGFILELHRLGAQRPELVEAKLAGAALVDAELRALERALRDGLSLGEIRAPGIGGACENCGAVHGSTDRFCATCGVALTAASAAEPSDSTGHSPAEPDALGGEA